MGGRRLLVIPDDLSRWTIGLGLAGGIGHAVLALWLSTVVRGTSFAGRVPESPSGAVFVSITVAGLVLLGGIPLVLYVRRRLVAPLFGLLVLFAWAFYSSWHHFAEARATGATPIEIYADSLFGVLWIVPLAVVVLLGLFEHAVRSRVDGRSLEGVFG